MRPLASIRIEERKQRVGRLRPRKGCARLVGQESARLDLQKPTGAITRDELQKALLMKAYPQLSKTDIMAAWEYAARAAAEEIVLAES